MSARIPVPILASTRGLVIGAAALVAMGSARAENAAAAQSESSSSHCSAPELRQFGFWIGTWDVFEIGGSERVAQVRVDSILDGCAVHEIYEDPNGLHGESFSIYDAPRKIWHQTWVTNHGQLLVVEGKFEAARWRSAAPTGVRAARRWCG